MKNMILASTAVGVLVASLIIAFSNRKNKSGNSIKGAAKNAYGMMNEGIGGIERSTARNFS
jgi:hypothetical protein